MKYLVFLLAIAGCSKSKIVKNVKMSVTVDTVYTVTATDGTFCRTPAVSVVGDTATCYWYPK